MNMYKIILALGLLLSGTTIKAQLIENESKFKFDALGGIGVSTYFGEDIIDNKPIMRLFYGGRVAYYVKPWVALESGYSHSVLGTNENNDFLQITHTVKYHQIPMLLRLKNKRLSLGVGAEYNILQDVDVTYQGAPLDDSIIELYNKTLWTAYAGLKVDVNYYSSLGLNVTYGLEPILNNNYDWKLGMVRVCYVLRVY